MNRKSAGRTRHAMLKRYKLIKRLEAKQQEFLMSQLHLQKEKKDEESR